MKTGLEQFLLVGTGVLTSTERTLLVIKAVSNTGTLL